MIIDSLIIKGFSNIEHIRLDIGDINALIAPNGYGKSNVLNAISFGLMYLNANEETKGQMLRSRFLPINVSIREKNIFEIVVVVATTTQSSHRQDQSAKPKVNTLFHYYHHYTLISQSLSLVL